MLGPLDLYIRFLTNIDKKNYVLPVFRRNEIDNVNIVASIIELMF